MMRIKDHAANALILPAVMMAATASEAVLLRATGIGSLLGGILAGIAVASGSVVLAVYALEARHRLRDSVGNG